MPESVCNRSDVLFCEDWEWSTDANFVAVATDWTSHNWTLGNPLATYPENNVYGVNKLAQGVTPYTGNCCLQLAIFPGINDTQFPDRGFTDQNGPVYARLYVQFSKGYVFFPAPNDSGEKIAYLRALGPPPNSPIVWRTELSMTCWDKRWDTFDFATSTCPAGTNQDQTQGDIMLDNFVHALIDLQAFHQLNFACVANPDPRPLVRIQAGRWYSFEFLVKKNSTTGSTDGALGLWVDGRQIVNRSGIDIGATTSDFINNFWITAYYGGASANTLATKQYVWYDNLVVSTSYIGPLSSSLYTTSGGASGQGIRYTGRRRGWR